MIELAFSHVAISCQNPLRIEQFYTKHFGFKRARVIPVDKDQIVFIKKGSIYLELFRATEEAPTTHTGGSGPEYSGLRHIAFIVDNIDTKLAEMGDDAKITLGPVGFDAIIPGWRTVWIADIEGNIVEISQGYVDQEDPPLLS